MKKYEYLIESEYYISQEGFKTELDYLNDRGSKGWHLSFIAVGMKCTYFFARLIKD